MLCHFKIFFDFNDLEHHVRSFPKDREWLPQLQELFLFEMFLRVLIALLLSLNLFFISTRHRTISVGYAVQFLSSALSPSLLFIKRK